MDPVEPGRLLIVGIHNVPNGVCLMSVCANISSLAREYSTQRLLDSRCMVLDFPALGGILHSLLKALLLLLITH